MKNFMTRCVGIFFTICNTDLGLGVNGLDG